MPYQLTNTDRSLLDFKGVPVTILNDDGTTKKMLIACYFDFKYLQELCKELLEAQSPPPDPIPDPESGIDPNKTHEDGVRAFEKHLSRQKQEANALFLAQRYKELKAQLEQTAQELGHLIGEQPHTDDK